MERLKRKGMELAKWTGGKKKKQGEVVPTAPQSLWVYGGNEDTDWNFGVSEPTEVLDASPVFKRIKGLWTVSLKIFSSKGFNSLDEVTHQVSVLLDQYHGMNTNKRAYLIHLLALIPHLGGRRDNELDQYTYQSGYNEVIDFDFSHPDEPSEMPWAHTENCKINLGGLSARIEYSVKFSPSVRKPVNFKAIYYSPAAGGKIPPLEIYGRDLSLSLDESVTPIRIL
ncbi:matrix [Iriri virus]|uniref:Matrix protein n=1 Tax=Iriri virus TaxID=1620893 RepID=A0A0D3R1J9_9RHAB|nr:matrix [Iriri virus]AJR28377.1 matrix [Iriri virus]